MTWPFSIHPGCTSNGLWELSCRCPASDLVNASSRLGLAVEFFFSLVRHGAFGPPSDAQTLSLSTQHSTALARASGRCESFDSAWIGVLLNLVEHLLPNTDELRILLPFAGPPRVPPPGVYPQRSLRFPIDDFSQDENFEIELRFAQTLDALQHSIVEDALSDWWCIVALGGFREENQSVHTSGAIPPQALEGSGAEFYFTMNKVRASTVMIDALAGIASWIDQNVAKLTAVRIS